MKCLALGVALLLTPLPTVAQQASIQIDSVDLTLGMTKKEVFRKFAKVFSTEKKFETADEIPDGAIVNVCSDPVKCAFNEGELQFHNSRLNYVGKPWYTNTSAPATITEVLGAISKIAPSQKASSCTVLYNEEHTLQGIIEKTWITCGVRGVIIARLPFYYEGNPQPEVQDIIEFIGERR